MVVVKDRYSQLVYPIMLKISNLLTFGLEWSSKLQENNERKNTLVSDDPCVVSDDLKRCLYICAGTTVGR